MNSSIEIDWNTIHVDILIVFQRNIFGKCSQNDLAAKYLPHNLSPYKFSLFNDGDAQNDGWLLCKNY